MTDKIRILLADDQALLRAGFRALIDAADDLVVVAEAASGDEAIAQARQSRADVVLMDVRMPGSDGLSATRAICSDDELAGVRVIILTTFELDEYVVEAVRAGASGFLSKAVGRDELLDAIRLVASGEALLSPRATAAVMSRMSERGPRAAAQTRLEALTPREREIVALVAHGLSNDEIAEQLVLSRLTVKTHVNRAMVKTDSRDRAQLVVAAYQAGLVQPDGGPG